MNESASLYLRQIEVGPMENFIYLLGDRNKKECVIVDPAWEVDRILEEAARDEMKVTGALITHTHYDHCNGVEDLLERCDARIYVHKAEAEFLKGMKSSIKPVESGDKLTVGNLTISFLHTPGHTPGSQCFFIENRLVSGDTLFINACGRCDLPGGSAEQMYESLQRLAKLQDDVILLPGHNYDAEPTSTVGREKAQNPYYQCASMADFLSLRTGR